MRRFLLYACLLVSIATQVSCQKKEDGVSFESIYPANYITKIQVKEKDGGLIEISNIEDVNKWIDKVKKIKFIREENQEDRELLLIYNGCIVKAYRNEKEIGDFKILKLNGVFFKENIEFEKQVESLCK
ncbi:hypothetical protein [Neobacillus terrae]|uniref:hypothetical protein n=1 Tax=Neobacillus terrae TaxID=3034837 RepID=UPI00140CEEA0|nr:hypothetical protein [Neobacillus terrae]NHM34100.1 hypothetical protein [Neobacillus terrae]